MRQQAERLRQALIGARFVRPTVAMTEKALEGILAAISLEVPEGFHAVSCHDCGVQQGWPDSNLSPGEAGEAGWAYAPSTGWVCPACFSALKERKGK